MIPKVGDRVLVNPMFRKQYSVCKGIGILMPAHKSQADATDLLYPPAPQSRDWDDAFTVTRVVANDPNPDKAHFWVELAEFPKGIWLEPTGRYAECRHCCQEGCPLSERESFFVLSVAEVVEMTPNQIKRANTRSDASFCAACGGRLKDPGLGPTYRHCPKCEP
jgi:hypothetical protein